MAPHASATAAALVYVAVAHGVAADTAVQCTAPNVEPNWPTYHVMNNVPRKADGTLSIRALNDANAIFYYKGLFHMMEQAGGGTWTHEISNDLVHWYTLQDALGPGLKNSSWDHSGPCDGTASFPAGQGEGPIIMYGPDCGDHMPPPSAPGADAETSIPPLGDFPRVAIARPADPSSPYLHDWVKTPGNPVTWGGGKPCSFPGRVWKSEVGDYWNMLCAFDGRSPWARYVSSDKALLKWKMASQQFTVPHGVGAAAGALFHPIPNPVPGGPTHMINGNTGTEFLLGTYDSKTETMNITSGHQNIESGHAYHWAAAGYAVDNPDPVATGKRLITVAWVSNRPSVMSLIRELSYDHKTDQLVSYPVAEYSALRNATFMEGKGMTLAKGALTTLPVPQSAGGAVDVSASFDVAALSGPAQDFGIVVRAPKGGTAGGVKISFSVLAPDASGVRVVHTTSGTSNLEPVKVMPGETLDVRVLVDRPLVEAFVMGGRAAAVSADTTFNVAQTSVHLFNSGTVPISASKVSAYGMGCGWAAEMPAPKGVYPRGRVHCDRRSADSRTAPCQRPFPLCVIAPLC